jgi:hypothetical protein
MPIPARNLHVEGAMTYIHGGDEGIFRMAFVSHKMHILSFAEVAWTEGVRSLLHRVDGVVREISSASRVLWGSKGLESVVCS